MQKSNVSVLIPTHNRPKGLSLCLQSLSEQTILPYEIIVIDNSCSSITKKICTDFSTKLPIVYTTERKGGASFARNKGIQLARGAVIAFIDDDCIAGGKWVEIIQKHFALIPSVGVIGYSIPIKKDNISSTVEDIYYHKMLFQYVSSSDKPQKLHSGASLDSRNAAFLSRFIKKFRFTTSISIYCEDVELGIRLFNASSHIYYDPKITVRHQNSDTFMKLFKRNFITGYNTQLLLHQLNVPIHQLRRPYDKTKWHTYISQKNSVQKGMYRKLLFMIAIRIYPWFSRLGRLIYVLENGG